MTGRVCPKHEEWCPTGECRWCAPEEPMVFFGPRNLASPEGCDHESHGFYNHGYYMTCSHCGQVLTMDNRVVKTLPLLARVQLRHLAACRFRGRPAGDPEKDLAAGCTCLPVP